MRQNIDEIKKILGSIPEYFQILESKTDWDIHRDYIKMSEELSFQEYTDTELIIENEKLFQDTVSEEIKKEILIKLGNSGTVDSYRAIEKFCNSCGKGLKTWSVLALQECRMLLESYLTDCSSGFISTGLGGKDNKLRFFYVVFTKDEKPFTLAQQKLIKLEFELICETLNSKVEEIDFRRDYSCLTILLPMDIAPDTIIMKGINKCNELGEFIVPHYFVTNVEIPSEEKILVIIKEMREDIE